MDIFTNKLNFDFKTNQKVTTLISEIDSFKGKWEVTEELENRYLNNLKSIATIESIGSSTRIEGAILTDDEIQELLTNLKITKLTSRHEQEVIGYYKVISLIYDNFDNIEISENYIKHLHKLLLKYSSKDERHRGDYKALSNKVVAKYPGGKQKVIFATTEPALVEKEMRELVRWLNRELHRKEIHPLIIIGSFIYDFLSIHPFKDGNGRLSRLLTTLCLLKTGYRFIQYVSFEHHIEAHKKQYYQALMSGQKNRNTQKEKIDKWILFYLGSLKDLSIKLNHKYDLLKSKGRYLNDRQKEIRNFIADNQPVKISDIAEHLSDINYNTLKKDLQYLRQEQLIQMMGKGRGSFYILADEEV